MGTIDADTVGEVVAEGLPVKDTEPVDTAVEDGDDELEEEVVPAALFEDDAPFDLVFVSEVVAVFVIVEETVFVLVTVEEKVEVVDTLGVGVPVIVLGADCEPDTVENGVAVRVAALVAVILAVDDPDAVFVGDPVRVTALEGVIVDVPVPLRD